MDVLIVGSGIAGLSCAFHLLKHSPTCRITLVEEGPTCGGHSKTIVHEGELVDLGFQVFNRETYPTLCEIYRELGVNPVSSDMSFATEVGGQSVKFGADLRPLLKWMLREPGNFLAFIRSKSKFHSSAFQAMADPEQYPSSLGEFFSEGYSKVFYQNWIVPFASAVWSLREGEVSEFDVQIFLRFMLNHGFLSWTTLQWLTLGGGAKEEVDAFLSFFEKTGRTTILTNTRAIAWNAATKQLTVSTNNQQRQLSATHLVLAVAAPIARDILGSSSVEMIPELQHFAVSSSDIVLHADERMMPEDRDAWASWNGTRRKKKQLFVFHRYFKVVRGVSTYWLHSIQKCRVKNQQLFVSVMSAGSDQSSFPRNIVSSWKMSHPMLQHGTLPMQKALLSKLFVDGSVAFVGAWLQYGFHEDGALTGAIGARNISSNATIPILRPSHPLCHTAQPIWVAETAKVKLRNHDPTQYSFLLTLLGVAHVVAG